MTDQTPETNVEQTEKTSSEPEKKAKARPGTRAADSHVAQLEAATADKARLEKQIAQMEEEQNVKAQDFEKLWRNEQERSKTYEQKIEHLSNENKQDREVFFTGLKQSAIESAAHKMGIDKDYMKFLTNESFSGVDIETTSTGKVNVLGAQEFVETFKKENPRLFKDSADPNFNFGGGSSNTQTDGKLTASEILKLEKTDPVKYSTIMKDYKKYLKK